MYSVNYLIVKHFAFFDPVRFFFSTQKWTVSCVCVRGGGGLVAFETGVGAYQKIWL